MYVTPTTSFFAVCVCGGVYLQYFFFMFFESEMETENNFFFVCLSSAEFYEIGMRGTGIRIMR